MRKIPCACIAKAALVLAIDFTNFNTFNVVGTLFTIVPVEPSVIPL